MSEALHLVVSAQDDAGWEEARRWAAGFLTSRRDLECWFAYCAEHRLHPYLQIRRNHVELYLRELELTVRAWPTPRSTGACPR